ncbi:hypothetical protein [Variovorax sp. PAMC 28711]|nr:hypothetical protein [Variovorax sp. PAMC 28711]
MAADKNTNGLLGQYMAKGVDAVTVADMPQTGILQLFESQKRTQ